MAAVGHEQLRLLSPRMVRFQLAKETFANGCGTGRNAPKAVFTAHEAKWGVPKPFRHCNSSIQKPQNFLSQESWNRSQRNKPRESAPTQAGISDRRRTDCALWRRILSVTSFGKQSQLGNLCKSRECVIMI